MDEIKITKEVFEIKPTILTSSFITNLIHLFQRFAIYSYDLFQKNFQNYTTEKNINAHSYFLMLIELMTQTITIEVRKINLLFICQMMPLLGFDFFTQNCKTIYEICFNLAHKDYIKKKGAMNTITHDNDQIILTIKEAKVVKIVTSPNGFINSLVDLGLEIFLLIFF